MDTASKVKICLRILVRAKSVESDDAENPVGNPVLLMHLCCSRLVGDPDCSHSFQGAFRLRVMAIGTWVFRSRRA